MKLGMTWPEIFDKPELIKTATPRSLCADGLVAWANCMMGSAPPQNFGEVLVAIADRLDMEKGPTADNLSEHAELMGWLSKK